jgi:hypothetical protein
MTRKYLDVIFSLAVAIAVTAGTALWRGVGSYDFAVVFHFILMLPMVSIMLAVMPAFTSAWFVIRAWERDGKPYERLGVNLFRKVTVWTGWEKLKKATRTAAPKPAKNNLADLEYRTKQTEFAHLVVFFIVSAFALVVTFFQGISQCIWLLSLQIPLHVYPIILQRYNRARFQKVLAKATRSCFHPTADPSTART